ncbi:MAG: cytosine permease, partial [Vicinamibacterales bacterium]
MHAADLEPIPQSERHQSAFDLFLIFAGANIVATTLQTGATLSTAYDPAIALLLITSGALIGSAIVAVLAPLGPRLGVPSVIALRAVLGIRGAAAVALLLYV